MSGFWDKPCTFDKQCLRMPSSGMFLEIKMDQRSTGNMEIQGPS